jgi:hypothetical protein
VLRKMVGLEGDDIKRGRGRRQNEELQDLRP